MDNKDYCDYNTSVYLNELGYPLMMDSKYRRAIVYNKKGLEQIKLIAKQPKI